MHRHQRCHTAEGGIRLFSEGSLLPSGKTEMRRATGGLGGEASSEAEIASRGGKLWTSRTLVLGRGPSAYWAFGTWRGLVVQA